MHMDWVYKSGTINDLLIRHLQSPIIAYSKFGTMIKKLSLVAIQI